MQLATGVLFILLLILPEFEGKGKGCPKLLSELSEKNAAFIQCVSNFAAPIKICIECVDNYKEMQTAYKLLIAGEDVNGTMCGPQYIDVDRLNLISNTENEFTTIWNNAFCSECYNADGTAVSSDTQNFTKLYSTYESCKIKHLKKDEYCEKCKGFYNDLNSQYKMIKKTHEDKVCFDLEDQMNRTRSDWTKTCGHGNPTVSLVAFAAVSSVLSSIPIFFYCGFFLYTRRSERNHQVLTEDLPVNNPDPGVTLINETTSSREMLMAVPSTSSNTNDGLLVDFNKV